MDISAISQIVGSLGFPIAMCIWMARHMEKMSEQHAQEIGQLRDVIADNTLVVTKLCDKIDTYEGVYDSIIKQIKTEEE